MAEITIYEHANFQGRSQTLTAGQYDVAQLLIGNDTLSSARVPVGMVLRLYEHAHYQGASIEYRQDTPYVGGEWNDRVSSIIVYMAPPPAAPPTPPAPPAPAAPPAPLSLDSIYRPFNEFFSHKFATGAGSLVTFRFASLPQAFVDSHFLPPLHPEWGPSQAVAQEVLSTVIDGVPRLNADGHTVWMSTARLSELYHDEIVGPAIPFIPPDVTDDTEKQARIEAFITAKADALGLWEKIKAVSLLEGTGVEFRPSTATPGTWWDRKDVGVWTHQSFEVKGAVASPGQPAPPSNQLLRMKVDDITFRSAYQTHMMVAAPLQSSSAQASRAVMYSHARPDILQQESMLDLDEAQRLHEEAKALLAKYEGQLHEGERLAGEIATQAETQRERLEAKMRADYETALKRRTELAMERIQQEEARAMQEVRTRAADLAVRTTRRLLTERIGQDEAQSMVKSAIAEVGRKLA